MLRIQKILDTENILTTFKSLLTTLLALSGSILDTNQAQPLDRKLRAKRTAPPFLECRFFMVLLLEFGDPL